VLKELQIKFSDRILISRRRRLFHDSDQSKALFVLRNRIWQMMEDLSQSRDNIIFLKRKETACTFLQKSFASFKKMINLMKISGLKEMERE